MLEVKGMPLYWRFKDATEIESNVPPARMPFIFDYDSGLDLFIEKRTAELSDLLKDIYSRNANVGFLQDGHSLIETYGADFWKFLNSLQDDFSGQTILEIGCGGCIFLERFRKLGCHVVGIDPSPFASEAGKDKGIEVIQDFFPVSDLKIVPNVIFQIDVLEHVEDPVTFLKSQADCLADDGLIVVNVPDCTRSIDAGDISMALHQHVNMFDIASIENVFQAANLEVVRLEQSKYGSALFCAARKSKKKLVLKVNDVDRWVEFQSRAEKNIKSFEHMVGEAREKGTVGFFMPQRAFPYLGMMEWFEDYRVFDNMNVWHDRYLDGLDIKIENQQDLVKRPVDHLFIMSLTFGQNVADEIRNELNDIEITTLEDIIAL